MIPIGFEIFRLIINFCFEFIIEIWIDRRLRSNPAIIPKRIDIFDWSEIISIQRNFNFSNSFELGKWLKPARISVEQLQLCIFIYISFLIITQTRLKIPKKHIAFLSWCACTQEYFFLSFFFVFYDFVVHRVKARRQEDKKLTHRE